MKKTFKNKNVITKITSSVTVAALLSVFNTSCSNDIIVDVPERPAVTNNETTVLNPDACYRLTADEAQIAIASFWEKKTELRSESAPTIKNIEVITESVAATKSVLRSSSSETAIDTLSYIINMDNNAGFAIVSADKRTEDPVLYFAEEGNFSLKEMLASDIDDPFLFQVECMKEYIKDCREDYSESQTTRVLNFEPIIGNDMRLYMEVTPIVKIFWHQNAPFNDQGKRI